MKLLTKGVPIIEQLTPLGASSLAIPKEFIQTHGIKAGELLYFSIDNDAPGTLIKYSREPIGNKRKVTIFNGYARVTIPKHAKIKHGKGYRWECYDSDGSLYYALIPKKRIM